MDYLQVYANAKINLALDITGKRADGYHELNTVMQSICLRDTIILRKIFAPKIKVSSNIKWLHNDERNLAYKAAKTLFDKFSPDYGVYIEIIKQIPISAGLGGGSADCAAVLSSLVRMFDFPINTKELMAIAKSLGADVPFCLLKGTVLAQGIGDILTPLEPCPNVFIAIAKPPICISTGDVFRQYCDDKVIFRPDIDKMIENINKGHTEAIAAGLINVLESVTAEEFPIIKNIKKTMMDHNALGAAMSGSGPTVFGMFENKQNAFDALTQIKSEFSVKEAYLSRIFNPGRHEPL